jgi:hypothetical protein
MVGREPFSLVKVRVLPFRPQLTLRANTTENDCLLITGGHFYLSGAAKRFDKSFFALAVSTQSDSNPIIFGIYYESAVLTNSSKSLVVSGPSLALKNVSKMSPVTKLTRLGFPSTSW